MSAEKERVDEYLATIARLEPDLHSIDSAAGWASISISLKRLADAAEKGKKKKVMSRVISLPYAVDYRHLVETREVRSVVQCSAKQLAEVLMECLQHIEGRIVGIKGDEEGLQLYVYFEVEG